MPGGCRLGGVLSPMLNGLVGYWKLDGNSLDSKNGSHGTNVGPITYEPAHINSGAIFAAGSPRINVPSVSLGNEYTFTVWIRPDAPANASGFAGLIYGIQGNSLSSGLYLDWDGSTTYTLGFAYNTNNVVYDTAIAPYTGLWTHVALAKSASGNIKFYVNGARTATPDFPLGSMTLSLTKFGTGDLSGSFKGGMDEIGAWNRELTPTEIAALYNSGAGRKYPFDSPTPTGHVPGPGAIAYWPLDEASGTATAVDAAGVVPANNLTTFVGTPTVETGKLGNARHFNASYVRGPANPAAVSIIQNPGGGHSLGFWAKYNEFSGFGYGAIRGLLGLYEATDITITPLYVLTFNKSLGYGNSTGGNNSVDFFTGFEDVWVHCVITYSAPLSQVRIYRNGVNLGGPTLGISTAPVPNPTWVLGRGYPDTPTFLLPNIALDEVWFENGVYTPSQVLADYNRWRPV